MAQICTKFETEVENGVPQTDYCENSHCAKIQDGGSRHFEII